MTQHPHEKPAGPGHPTGPGCPAFPDYPQPPDYPSPPAAGKDRAARLAALSYLTVPLSGFVVPLAVRQTAGERSGWLRGHASQALNVWLTVLLYEISAAIMGAMLALDSPAVAVVVAAPLLLALWLVTLTRLARAARAAREGGDYTFPRWLCSPFLR